MSTMLNSNAIKNGSISKEKLTEALQQEVSKKLKGKVAPDAYGLGYGFYSPHKFNINSVFNIQKDGDGNIVSFTVGSVERINVYVVHMGYSEYQFDEFIQCQEGVIYWQWENEAKSFKFIKDNIPYDYGFDWGYTFTLTHPSEAQFHDVNDILRFLNDDECLIITEYWPHKPLDDLFIPGTIARRSELSKVATSGSYNDLSNKPTIPAAVTESTVSNWGFTKNQGTITDVKVNGTSVATSGVAEINIKASDLGVTGALKYCGITTTQLTDGATTNPVVIDGENHTAEAGCVVFYEDNGNTKEFVFNGSKWELLGSDLTYKVVQNAVSSPSTNGTAMSFIDTISQDANGVITATKKNVDFSTHYHNGSTITGGTTGDVLISNGWSSSWRKIEDTDIIFSETESLYAKVSPIDMAISPLHSANRIEFANPDGITIEYSRDGGNTWIDYGAANSDKVAVCSTIGCDFRTGGVTTGTTTSYQLRVILNARDMGCYTRVTKMLVNISTDGTNGTKLKVEQSTIGAPNTYTSLGEYQIGGWSGWNSIPLKKMGTFGGWDTNQNFNTRLTFSFSSYDNGYNGASLTVRNILLFGETDWTTPSEMARTGHLYSYDVSQNATFPSNVNVRGNLTVNNGRQIQEVALSGSYNDLSNKPTFKTINNQSIVGNGNIQINADFIIATNSEIDALFDNSSSNQGSY